MVVAEEAKKILPEGAYLIHISMGWTVVKGKRGKKKEVMGKMFMQDGVAILLMNEKYYPETKTRALINSSPILVECRD